MFYDVLLCRISEAYLLSGQGENPATETYHVFTSKELAGPMAHRLPNKAHNQKRRGASWCRPSVRTGTNCCNRQWWGGWPCNPVLWPPNNRHPHWNSTPRIHTSTSCLLLPLSSKLTSHCSSSFSSSLLFLQHSRNFEENGKWLWRTKRDFVTLNNAPRIQLAISPSLDTQWFFRKSWPPKTPKQDLWNLSLDPKQNRNFSHNNKEFQIAMKNRTNWKQKHTHIHNWQQKTVPLWKRIATRKAKLVGLWRLSRSLFRLSDLWREVTNERTNSARARSAGGGGPVRSRIPLPGLFTKSVGLRKRMVALGFRALYVFSVTGSSH